jgi:predicted DNA-binding transcriptional regulator AlpA
MRVFIVESMAMLNIDPGDALLTEKQVASADFLNLKNPRTLSQWRVARTGPRWIRVGTHLVRYRRSDVLKWLADCNGDAGDDR